MTGFWLEELVGPYYTLHDAGIEITLVSPKGGQPPLDPKSDEVDAQTQDTERFRTDRAAQQALATTVRVDTLRAEDPHSIALIEQKFANGKPVAAMCHGPGVLRHAKKPDGTPLVVGKRVTGFTNSEEQACRLTTVVPFSVEDELRRHGSHFERSEDWQSYSVTDGHLVTDQNPASSTATAQNLLKILNR